MQTISINNGDLVRVINDKGEQLKRGIVVKSTSIGGYVYQRRTNQNDNSGDVSPESCEWFAFNGPKLKMELITPAADMKTRSGKTIMPI
jgi:hypothetical protein